MQVFCPFQPDFTSEIIFHGISVNHLSFLQLSFARAKRTKNLIFTNLSIGILTFSDSLNFLQKLLNWCL